MSTLGSITLTSQIRDAHQKRIVTALAHTQTNKQLNWKRMVHDRTQNSQIINKFLSGCANEAQLEAIIALSDWSPVSIAPNNIPFWKGITAYRCNQHLGSTNYLNLAFQVPSDLLPRLPIRLSISQAMNAKSEQGYLVTGFISSKYIEQEKNPMTMITTLLLKQEAGVEFIEDILLGDATAHSRVWVPSILSKDNDTCPAENALSLGLETVIID